MGMMFSPALLSCFYSVLIHSCTLHPLAARSWFAPRGVTALIQWSVTCMQGARVHISFSSLQVRAGMLNPTCAKGKEVGARGAGAVEGVRM